MFILYDMAQSASQKLEPLGISFFWEKPSLDAPSSGRNGGL